MKKIMFDDRYGQTEAVLRGEKMQTRRIITCPKYYHGVEVRGFYVRRNGAEKIVEVCTYDGNINGGLILPKYKVGEVVAVAQSYKDAGFRKGYYRDEGALIPLFVGNDTKNDIPVAPGGWNNKMFVRADLMPHRIRITDVRVERLQDISDGDCIKEGIEWDHTARMFYVNYNQQTGSRIWLGSTNREAYAALIDKISGKGTWERNPFAFVYDFELVKSK